MIRLYFKSGLAYLKKRIIKPKEFETLLNQLPPITKKFFSYFETGTWSEMLSDFECVLVNQGELIKPNIVEANWGKSELINNKSYNDFFSEIMTCDEILDEFKSYANRLDDWHKIGLLKIGYMEANDIILLGMEKHNLDEIWVYGEASFDFQKFADDIFDFFSNIEYSFSEDKLKFYYPKYTLSDLYKNWGEDFWRVREK